MKRNKYIFIIFCGILSMMMPNVTAQNLVPIPAKMEARSGQTFLWANCGSIKAEDGLENEAAYAKEMLKKRADVDVDNNSTATAALTLGIDATLTDDEAYTLTVGSDGVTIKGKTSTGVFWGLMTLEQLMIGDGSAITCDQTEGIYIEDKPRTHVRELMVDPARIFIPFESLKSYIPEMARYKLNSLHLHLVDDQGWRIEIKSYPLLTSKGSSRVGMDDMQMAVSGFYTQEQMRELVAYAAKYHVMIVPEIEMPGHETAAIYCYPYLTCNSTPVTIRTTSGVSNNLLCPGRETTYTFLGNVFRELADIFPCKYIHLGGDEAGNPALDCWTTCPDCQKLKTTLGISPVTNRKDNWQLQQYLFDRIIDTLRTKYNKTPMFWYETDFQKIQEGCVTFAWRHGLTQAAINAAVSNKALIMLCPGEHCYLDYPEKSGDMPEVNWGMPVTSLKQTYNLDPAWGNDATFENNYLFGVAGTLWSECINSPERVFYQAFPRGLALAEAGWSPQKNRSWNSFITRIVPIMKDMQRRGIAARIPSDWTEMQ